MLSVIFCGRNDNHNGDFERRALLAQAHNRRLLAAHAEDVEWIYVEWNPLPERPLFGRRLLAVHPDLHAYVAPPAIHAHLCDHPDVGVLQFFAKNAGARRAHGDTLLITNADTFFSADIVARLAAGVAARTLYIYERLDLDSRLLEGREPTAAELADPAAVVKRHAISPPHCFGAAGDLMLLAHGFFEELTGFCEAVRFSSIHVDTMFCRQVQLSGGTVVVDGRVRHIDHADSFARSSGRPAGNHNGSLYQWARLPLPYRNPGDWGLASAMARATDGAAILDLPGRLRPIVPETPRIPAQWRPDPEFQPAFDNAVDLLRRLGTPVLLDRAGAELHAANALGQLAGLNVAGLIAARPLPGLDCPLLRWDEAADLPCAAVLIGDARDAREHLDRAIARWGHGRVLPCLGGSFCDLVGELDRQQRDLVAAHLLNVWQLVGELRPRRVLFGAGAHSAWFLELLRGRGLPPPVAVLDDTPTAADLAGVPVRRAAEFPAAAADAVIVSSDSAAGVLEARARQLFGPSATIVNPYSTFTCAPCRKEPR